LAASAKKAKTRSIDAGSNRSSEEFNRHYDNLKKYLMLTAGPEKLDDSWSEWASPRIAQSWADALGAQTPEERTIALETVKQYFQIVGPHPLVRDDRLVARARSELLRTPQMGALYETLVRDTNTEIAPIRRETIFYGSIAPYVTAKRGLKVDGAYTKLGWAKIRRLLDVERSKLLSEGWVLGTTTHLSDDDIAKQVQVLRQIYYDRFRDAWREFIADLEVSQPKNAEGALDQLLALSEPEWPYLRLVRILDENVSLELSDAEAGKPNSLLQTAAELAKTKVMGGQVDAGALLDRERAQSPVELAFKPMTVFGVGPKGKVDPAAPTGLAQYQAIVRKLVGVLTDMKDAKAAPDPKAVTGEFENAFRATTSLLADQDAFTRPLLTPLLLNPITLAWASVLRDAGGAAGGLWEVSVWKAWSSKLEPLYPFADAPNDAKVEDFTEFFRPQTGQLWGFYEQSLKGSLDRQGGEFLPTRRFKAVVPYSPAFLGCLKRGAKITEATFATDGKAPAVGFEINLHSVSPDVAEVAIEVDGVSHTYTNTPEQWVAMQWPAKEAKVRGARVRVRGFSGLSEEIVRMGDFGFFRMLDAADLKAGAAASARASDPPVLIATWKLKSQAGSLVKMDIRPTRGDAPFSRGFFSTLRCPRIVTTGER
jgi:type VI secretion system protein ImpL